MLNLMNESYQHIFDEMAPIVRRHIQKEGRKLEDFKIVDRDGLSLRILAIDDTFSLWNLAFTFSEGYWPSHPIQSAARLSYCHEMAHFIPNGIATRGMSEIRRTKKVIEYFETMPDYRKKDSSCMSM